MSRECSGNVFFLDNWSRKQLEGGGGRSGIRSDNSGNLGRTEVVQVGLGVKIVGIWGRQR